jgi:hypothetical protein
VEGKMETNKIDYTKLNERIVEQAFASANMEITPEQKQKLIQDKLERAIKYSELLAKLPTPA